MIENRERFREATRPIEEILKRYPTKIIYWAGLHMDETNLDGIDSFLREADLVVLEAADANRSMRDQFQAVSDGKFFPEKVAGGNSFWLGILKKIYKTNKKILLETDSSSMSKEDIAELFDIERRINELVLTRRGQAEIPTLASRLAQNNVDRETKLLEQIARGIGLFAPKRRKKVSMEHPYKILIVFGTSHSQFFHSLASINHGRNARKIVAQGDSNMIHSLTSRIEREMQFKGRVNRKTMDTRFLDILSGHINDYTKIYIDEYFSRIEARLTEAEISYLRGSPGGQSQIMGVYDYILLLIDHAVLSSVSDEDIDFIRGNATLGDTVEEMSGRLELVLVRMRPKIQKIINTTSETAIEIIKNKFVAEIGGRDATTLKLEWFKDPLIGDQ